MRAIMTKRGRAVRPLTEPTTNAWPRSSLMRIFGGTSPLDVPYEFFLVSGAKMSSSKGVGTSAREIANFLPPEILRFLMIKIPPKRTVNFSTDFDYVVKLFNEHDRLMEASLAGRGSHAIAAAKQ